MTALSRVDIAAARTRHRIDTLVGAAGVKLRGTGRVKQGVCPFHDEAEGSFTVYDDSQRWYCFGCGQGGDAIDFIQRTESITFGEALRLLGSEVESPSQKSGDPTRTDPRSVPQVRDHTVMTAAARYYARALRESSEALAYLSRRGISIGTATRLGLGYAKGAGLREALLYSGFDGERVVHSGLFTERGAERFAGMVVIPDIVGGHVDWLGGRAVARRARPRFQALPGPKPMLGLGLIPHSTQWVIVTEGIFDWLTLTEWGLPACSALGTQGLERAARAVSGFTNVFLAFDRDAAGDVAAERLTALLGRRSALVTLPRDYLDVAELANAPDGRATFIAQLDEAARKRRQRA